MRFLPVRFLLNTIDLFEVTLWPMTTQHLRAAVYQEQRWNP